jgi:glycosyltransferase involved in cell wall biosynthesis
MTTNLLTVLAVTWNEEAIISDFIDWYRTAIPECTIVIYDNCSTDATAAIALRKGCQVRSFDTANTYDEQALIDIRNQRWKDHPSSYYCVVDADEWVAVTREFLVANLKTAEWDVCRCLGFDLFGDRGDDMWQLRHGVPNARYSKPVLFRNTIRETDFAPGSHDGTPTKHDGTAVRWCAGFPNLYHTKWRSWEEGIRRQQAIAARERSPHSQRMGWGFHYSLPEATHREYFTAGYRQRLRVV